VAKATELDEDFAKLLLDFVLLLDLALELDTSVSLELDCGVTLDEDFTSSILLLDSSDSLRVTLLELDCCVTLELDVE